MYEPLIFAGHILIFEMLMSQQTTHVVSCYLTLFAIFKSFPCFSSQVEVLTKIQSPEGNIPRGKKRKFSLSWRSRATVRPDSSYWVDRESLGLWRTCLHSRVFVGSITSRCFGKWARAHPPPAPHPDSRGPKRAAEIEPNCIGTTSIWAN